MKNRPNVLILFTDQQRYDTINAMGYSHMITPNLDRLVADGTSYVNAHSTNPICVPARMDLITGTAGGAHGYYSNSAGPIKDKSLPTLPGIFADNGYRTCAIGKMHFPVDETYGYQEMQLMEELPHGRDHDAYARYLADNGLGHIQNLHGVRPHIYHVPQLSQMEEKHHGTAWVADRTIGWLKVNGNEPFFLFSSWIHPHPPWALPEPYHTLYRDVNLPEPIARSRTYPYITEETDWYGDRDSRLHRRRIREAYYASITMVDKHLGRILDYLEQSGLMENTLVLFASDHGEMLYDKGYYTKVHPYDSSVRVPLIVRYPDRFGKQVKKEEFADLFDIMPTCLDVCGLSYPGSTGQMLGESLCAEHKQKDRNYQISSTGVDSDRWIMNKNRRYKYIYRYNRGVEEMYDMINDPDEFHNLLESGHPADPVQDETYRDLKQGALAFERSWAPENMIEEGPFSVIDGGWNHPNELSKFPFWANANMQFFDDRPNIERGRRFIEEVQHALSHEPFSAIKLQEVFNDPEWIANFMQMWSRFGKGEEVRHLLFKEKAGTIIDHS